jgi:excinuclease ABC subunit B
MQKSIFHIESDWAPAGDQPEAIAALTQGVESGAPFQTLLGVTGSGKTFTMANVIANIGKPTLVIAHNKTLAAQLAQEYQTFFPDHAVHYFVSYYDFYQPEAYLPVTDTYIEKDAQINEEIDRLRHASTQALLTRRDTIIVASVSCIYGLGSPAEYEKKNLRLSVGTLMTRTELLHTLVSIFFERTNADLTPGSFRSLGNRVEVMPISEKYMYSIDILAGKIGRIVKIDPVTQKILDLLKPNLFIMPPLLVVLQFIQMKMIMNKTKKKDEIVVQPTVKKPLAERLDQQTIMTYVLPLMIGFFALKFPLAVSLYWGVSTLFGIVQQWFVLRKK